MHKHNSCDRVNRKEGISARERCAQAASERSKDCRFFLLHLWCTVHDGQTQWRVSLEDVRSRRRRDFAGIEDMLAFLRADTNESDRRARNWPEEGA